MLIQRIIHTVDVFNIVDLACSCSQISTRFRHALYRYPAHDVDVQHVRFVNSDGRRVVDDAVVVYSAVNEDGSMVHAEEDEPARDEDADFETQIAGC